MVKKYRHIEMELRGGVATIKFRVRSITMRENDDRKEYSVDFDIMGIGFGKSEEWKKYWAQPIKKNKE